MSRKELAAIALLPWWRGLYIDPEPGNTAQ
jgi:hypothetical protein